MSSPVKSGQIRTDGHQIYCVIATDLDCQAADYLFGDKFDVLVLWADDEHFGRWSNIRAGAWLRYGSLVERDEVLHG